MMRDPDFTANGELVRCKARHDAEWKAELRKGSQLQRASSMGGFVPPIFAVDRGERPATPDPFVGRPVWKPGSNN
jgi:hypothetical protein